MTLPHNNCSCILWIILALLFMVFIGFGAGYFYHAHTSHNALPNKPIASQSPDISPFALGYNNAANKISMTSSDSRDCDSPQYILNTATIKRFEGFARGKWKEIKPFMHPTQPDIGYAWAIRKVRKDFNSESDAQEEMNPTWYEKWPDINKLDTLDTSNTIPCIIGPTENEDALLFYVIDSHHTLSALDYSEYENTYIYLNILFDHRQLKYDAFVAEMIQDKYTFLLAQKGTKKQVPVGINFNALPATFDFNKDKKTMGDSTWRALGGYSRKVKDAPQPFPQCIDDYDSEFCMRPFERVCDENGVGIPFYEFQWGYFYVDATYACNGEKNRYWKNAQGDDPKNSFQAKYDELLGKYYDDNGEWNDAEPSKDLEHEWRFAASLLVPLARNQPTEKYKPIDYFEADELPGYHEGHAKIGDDPSCLFGVTQMMEVGDQCNINEACDHTSDCCENAKDLGVVCYKNRKCCVKNGYECNDDDECCKKNSVCHNEMCTPSRLLHAIIN